MNGEPLEEAIHPLIKMYLGCRKWSGDGHRVIPWTGGWLDWDLHETKGYEWLEELVEEIKELKDRRAKAREASKGFVTRMDTPGDAH